MQCTVLTLSSAGSSHGEVRPRYALRYTAASRRQRTRGAPPPAGRFQKARCACRVALGPHGGVDGTRRVAASGPTAPTAPSAAGHPGTTSDCHEAPGLQLLLAFRQVACTPTWILPALRRRRFNIIGLSCGETRCGFNEPKRESIQPLIFSPLQLPCSDAATTLVKCQFSKVPGFQF